MGDSFFVLFEGRKFRAFSPHVTTKSYLTLLSLSSRSSQHNNDTHFNREHCRRVGQADGVYDQTVRSRSFREISEMLCFFTRSWFEGKYSRASAGEKGARRARKRARAFGGCFEGLRAQKRANIARLTFFLSRTDVSRCLASVLDNQSQISDRPISRFLNGVLTLASLLFRFEHQQILQGRVVLQVRRVHPGCLVRSSAFLCIWYRPCARVCVRKRTWE